MSLPSRLDRLLSRAEELRHMLSTAPGADIGALSKELAELEPLVEKVAEYRAAERARDEAQAMLSDPEMRELAEAEWLTQKERVPALEHEIRIMLLPRDAADERSAILEIRPRVRAAEIRKRRSSRPARANHGNPGAHPYLHGDGCRAAGSRGS